MSDALMLAEKWFGPIDGKEYKPNVYPVEPAQQEKRSQEISKDVPADRIYKAYHCCGRTDNDFYATDLLADLLTKGHSSRLYSELVRKRRIFTDLQAYHSGDLDKSLFVFEGKLVHGMAMDEAEQSIQDELENIKSQKIPDAELTKVKQMTEAMMVCSEIKIAHRALNLAFCEMLGDAGMVNDLTASYNKVDDSEINAVAKDIFREENASVIYYFANNPTSRKSDGIMSGTGSGAA